MRKNKGFTLVELIVVLVILAILAAILTPALLGYIDKAREKQDIEKAKACLDAAQAGFSEAYGKGYPIENGNVLGLDASHKHGKDIDAVDSSVGELIRNCTDEDPYIFMVATGNCERSEVSKHEMYTVYYACYVKEKDSRPYYFYDGEWSSINPTADNNTSIIDRNTNKLKMKNGKKIYIQYYLVCNTSGKNFDATYANNPQNIWYYLKEDLHKKYK